MAIPGLSAAVSAIQIAEAIQRIESNNAANAKTVGFKKFAVQTSDLFYNQIKASGVFESQDAGRRPIGVEIGSGAKINGAYRVTTQGDPKSTGQPLDVMISGPGYFAISIPSAPNGRAFTRNGNFHIDPDTNQIVSSDGNSLLDALTIPSGVLPSQITVGNDGAVSYKDSSGKSQQIGQFQVYNFPNEEGLQSIGNNMLVETDSSGQATTLDSLNYKFIQNALEESNVTTIEALSNLLEASRSYELNSRIICLVNDTQKELMQIK